MYEARDLTTGDVILFKSLDTLVRRCRGTHFQVVHSETVRPPNREVHILRRVPNDPASSIVTTVLVPTEAVEASASDEDTQPIF
jgi:hypothetical protein